MREAKTKWLCGYDTPDDYEPLAGAKAKRPRNGLTLRERFLFRLFLQTVPCCLVLFIAVTAFRYGLQKDTAQQFDVCLPLVKGIAVFP